MGAAPIAAEPGQPGWVQTNRGLVLPNQCNHLGWMRMEFYAFFFNDGGFSLGLLISPPGVRLGDTGDGIGAVVANSTMDFYHTLAAGDLLVIDGAIRRLGESSYTFEQRMFNSETRTYCARQRSVVVGFDMQHRRSRPFPADIRAWITDRLVPFAEGEA